jgi:hypothetical protein
MSVRLDIYTAIQTKLETITELMPAGTLHHIDIWNSQALPNNIEEHKQFRFPKVFVEFEKANYLNTKLLTTNSNIRGEQNYILNITLHVFTKHLTDETASFVDKEPLMESIKYAIKGMKGDNYGQLRLISDDYDKDHCTVFESQLIFSTLVQEPGVSSDLIDANDPVGTPFICIAGCLFLNG